MSSARTSGPALTFAPASIRKRLAKATGAVAVVPSFAAAMDAPVARALSEACREGAAAAVCLDADPSAMRACLEAVRAVAAEQAEWQASFPGPCPVFVRLGVGVQADLREVADAGAAAVVLEEGLEGSDALRRAAEEAGLAVITAGPGAAAGEDASPFPRLALLQGVEDGREVEAIRSLHAEGAKAVLLAFGDPFADPLDAGYVAALLDEVRRKRSGTYAAHAFGGAPVEDLSPQSKNPKLWRRAQKEAKEIMHDSKKKYGHLDKARM